MTYTCINCITPINFQKFDDFFSHLLKFHSVHTNSNGKRSSIICCYGEKNLCEFSDNFATTTDFANHIRRHHVESNSSNLTLSTLSINSKGDDGNRKKFICRKEFISNLFSLLNDPSDNSSSIRRSFSSAKYDTNIFITNLINELLLTITTTIPELNEHVSINNFRRYFQVLLFRIDYRQKFNSITKSSSEEYVEERNSIDGIPQYFFDRNFCLWKSQDDFSRIIPQRLLDSKKSNEKLEKLKLRDEIQEKLSMWLDCIEVNLARQIEEKSEHFFIAMQRNHFIRSDINRTKEKLMDLKINLKSLHDIKVVQNFKLIQLFRRREKYQKYLNLLHTLHSLSRCQLTLQLLLGTEDYIGAIKLIQSTQHLLSSEIRKLTCIRYTSHQLDEMEKLIKNMVMKELSERLIELIDIQTLLIQGGKNDDLTSIINRMTSYLISMNSLNCLKETCGQVEEMTMNEIKKLLKLISLKHTIKYIPLPNETKEMRLENHVTVLMEQLNEINSEGSRKNLLQKLSSLSFDKWVDMIDELLNCLFILFTRFNKLIKEFKLDQDVQSVYNLERCLLSVMQFTVNRINSLINSRFQSATTSDVDYIQFKRFLFLIHQYSQRCQSINGKYSTKTLSMTANHLSVNYVTEFHSHNRSKLEELFQSEKWKIIPRIPHSLQILTNTIYERRNLQDQLSPNPLTGMNNGKNHFFSTPIDSIQSNQSKKEEDINYLEIPNEAFKNIMSTLKVLVQLEEPNDNEDELLDDYMGIEKKENNGTYYSDILMESNRFFLPNIVCNAMQFIYEYRLLDEYVDNFTLLITGNCLEILRLFNSKTCQLILGGGIVHLGIARSISGKHLAICWRSLEFMLCNLIVTCDYFDERFMTKMNRNSSKNLLDENEDESLMKREEIQSAQYYSFRKKCSILVRDYLNHIHEIKEKIVYILMQQVRIETYEIKAPTPSNTFKTLNRNINSLFEMVRHLLPIDHIKKSIILRIHRKLLQQLSERLYRLDVKDDGGPLHGMMTSELTIYCRTIRSIHKSFHTILLPFDDIWNRGKRKISLKI
ncbi:hypothetical protein SNEBB_004690 [Seison nebaliae]|nr:hypothetical protein SNEBB_004690 [Seison nebaliae]